MIEIIYLSPMDQFLITLGVLCGIGSLIIWIAFIINIKKFRNEEK